MTTILAVDDSATMRKCLEITFAGSEFELVTVDTAEAALEKVKTVSPALIIADVSLPPNDGYELCSTIKLAAPQLPVLMLSSKQNPFDPTRGAQADGHIDKPFDTQVMQDKARAMVRLTATGDTDAPGAARPKAQPRSAAPAERSPSSKIPAPRRKRPTPAMMAAPEAQPPAGQVRRTVPFAMPGASQEGGVARQSPPPMRPEEKRSPTQPQPQQLRKPVMSDTLPGGVERPTPTAQSAVGQSSSRQPVTPQPFTPQPATPQPATPQPATPQHQPQPSAPPAGSVGLSPEAATDLHGKLQGMGLTQDQVNGVLALSRDLIEQVVWEVVPVLAETLIKEEIRRLTKE